MFFLIDKPAWMSSFDVIRKLRKSLNTKKMWHSGTLDPLATGCLLIATDKSTKLLSLLDWAKKEYLFTVRVDGKSDSLDTGTPIEDVDTTGFMRRTSEEIVDYLLSQKTQVPPQYSALHINGERAYDLARRGMNFSLPERTIDISDVQVIRIEWYSIELRVVISSGGYIRSLAPLLGDFCGIAGGYITQLHRTKIFTDYGTLAIENASNIDSPEVLTYSQIFHTIPTLEISDSEVIALRQWREILREDVRIFDENYHVFLHHSVENYMSLCKHSKWVFTIIKNDLL
jgi:tRNA pseudouridine55 synthase